MFGGAPPMSVGGGADSTAEARAAILGPPTTCKLREAMRAAIEVVGFRAGSRVQGAGSHRGLPSSAAGCSLLPAPCSLLPAPCSLGAAGGASSACPAASAGTGVGGATPCPCAERAWAEAAASCCACCARTSASVATALTVARTRAQARVVGSSWALEAMDW